MSIEDLKLKTKLKLKAFNFIDKFVEFLFSMKILKDNSYIREKILNQVKEKELTYVGGKKKFNLKEIMIEIVNRCNTVCIMCPRVNQKRKSGIMSLEFYRNLIQEAYDLGARAIYPYFMGESLILRNFCDYAKVAKDIGYTTIMLTTTGGLIKQFNTEELVTCGLTIINFSIDAVRQSSYEKIRTNMVLEEIEDSIRKIVQIKNKINPGLKITVKFMEYPGINDSEWPIFKKRWHNVADEIHHTTIHDWGGRTKLNSNRKFDLEEYCRYLRQKLIFNWDGTAPFCCNDYDNLLPIGKYPGQSLKEIMNSPELIKARNMHREGILSQHMMCKQCYMNMDEAVVHYYKKKYREEFLKFTDKIRGKSYDNV